MRVNYVIIFVSDMQRSVSFYRDVLGLPLKFETPQWTEFATEGATVALHVSETIGTEPTIDEDTVAGRSRPGFCVPDLATFHQRMIDQQVICVQPPQEIFGARIAQYLDPDGLAFSVSQDVAPG